MYDRSVVDMKVWPLICGSRLRTYNLCPVYKKGSRPQISCLGSPCTGHRIQRPSKSSQNNLFHSNLVGKRRSVARPSLPFMPLPHSVWRSHIFIHERYRKRGLKTKFFTGIAQAVASVPKLHANRNSTKCTNVSQPAHHVSWQRTNFRKYVRTPRSHQSVHLAGVREFSSL